MNIAVYCSAKNQIPEEYLDLGTELGRWLAENGHNLVFGGATGGLMTRVSEAFARSKERPTENEEIPILIGIVPEGIVDGGRKSEICDEVHIVGNMSERKQMMRDTADCFICLPGSYGTLDEMMDVIASATVGEHRKACLILNHKGFYNALLQQLTLMKELRFIPQKETYSPVFCDSLNETYDYINMINNKTK